MKFKNYDVRTLLYQQLRPQYEIGHPVGYTQAQYRILCNLIIQKKIKQEFFELIIKELYHLNDWKELNYSQMYELIHILTFWNYKKVKGCNYER